ncbi:MAG: zinc ribbon domain-containing protein [Sciscionella sp.]
MRAEPGVQRRLLELAEVDAELDRVDHRRRTLPELAEIESLEAEFRSRRDELVTVQTTLSDLDSDAKKQEKEIDGVRAREDRDRRLLDAGLPGKQQAEIEHELETLARRQGLLEDDLLELMERREAVAADVAHSEAQASAVQEKLAEANRRRTDALADLDDARARRDAERAELRGVVDEPLLTLYERVRGQKGIGAALLRHRRCGGCHLELDRSVMTAIKDASADEVLRCEECGAILVRTAESGL